MANMVRPAGTVRTDTMERMEAEGKIKISDFKIINQMKDNFPFVHSTPLYPEWPIAAAAHFKKRNFHEKKTTEGTEKLNFAG